MRPSCGLLACLALAARTLAPAAAAASSPDQGTPAATNMAAIFQRICLDAFPDPRAVGAALADSHATRMTPNETASLLQDGPGSGWRLSTATADYTITIEAPPYNDCAVRRMTRDGLPTALPYISAIQAYARKRAMLMGPVAALDQKTETGADEHLLATKLTGKANRSRPESAPESIMYVTIDFHGAYAGWAAEDAAGGTGIEVRMEHQITADR